MSGGPCTLYKESKKKQEINLMKFRMNATKTSLFLSLSFTFAPAVALAQNIDLSTLPGRDSVQLTIYNSEDLTLVRETRTLSFRKGANDLQFSWANTLIDPTSVELAFKSHAAELEIRDTIYPHDKPQMLYWRIQSELDGDAQVEITYFTSGLSWSADYVGIANPEENRMNVEAFVRIYNNSGEDYPDAQVRLVVGNINLVEAIAELARRGIISRAEEKMYVGAEVHRLRELPASVRAQALDAAEGMGGGRTTGHPAEDAKEIAKQGLSEYFLYTIEGTETIPNTWSKRMQLLKADEVAIRIQYRLRPEEYGAQLTRILLFRNDKESKLGDTPMPEGEMILFRRNADDGLSFLARQQMKYVPIGQEVEFNLGPDPEVIHEQLLMRSWRDNFWFRRDGATVLYSQAEGHKVKINDAVSGWEEHQSWVERIRNYRNKPIDVEIRRAFDGHILFKGDATAHDFRTVVLKQTVAPGAKAEIPYTVTARLGSSATQNNVTIEKP